LFSKSLIILRGLPGSGKSTLATILAENNKYPVFSIDDFFTDPTTGKYTFEFEKNHLAYKACEEKTLECMKNNTEKIFLHNVFSLEWEIEPYFKMAAENNYSVYVVTVENRHGNKNIHEIGDEQIEKMAAKYQVKLYAE
jgi:predicted kinase